MSIPALWRRRERRSLEWLVLATVVLPLATVAAVRWATLAWELSLGVVLVALFGLPMLGALVLVGFGPWGADPLDRTPDTGPERFRDRIPERYHEEFAPETLNEVIEEDPEPSRRYRYALLYCVMVPAFSLLVMVL